MKMKILVGACIIILTISLVYITALANYNNRVPLPLDSPPWAEYKLPDRLPGKTGGPYIMHDKVLEIANIVSKSKEGKNPQTLNVVLTTHQALIDEGIFNPSYSVASDREVYLVTMEGEFTFSRVMQGYEPIKSKLINIEIDANTGEVLAVGTSVLTYEKTVWENLEKAFNQ